MPPARPSTKSDQTLSVELLGVYEYTTPGWGYDPLEGTCALWTEPPGFKHLYYRGRHRRLPFPQLLYCFYRTEGYGQTTMSIAVVPSTITAPKNATDFLALDTRVIGLPHMRDFWCDCHGYQIADKLFRIGRPENPNSHVRMIDVMGAFWWASFEYDMDPGDRHKAKTLGAKGGGYVPRWEHRQKISYKYFAPRAPQLLLGASSRRITLKRIKLPKVSKQSARRR